MIKILFICHGNICRSPMAEFVMKYIAEQRGLSISVDSCATSTEELGNPVHYGTVQKLNELGIPIYPHFARRLTQKDYREADYLIAMDSNNLRNIERLIGKDKDSRVHLLLDFTERKGQSIADPWYTGNFDVTYDDIKEGCEGLADFLSGKTKKPELQCSGK